MSEFGWTKIVYITQQEELFTKVIYVLKINLFFSNSTGNFVPDLDQYYH